ncbi:PAS domain-containing protein [Candidatus Parcubacteria bacterium]|nr:MAG: PAS domain-containing protein [Candidatus Parcubacteria bacterium]
MDPAAWLDMHTWVEALRSGAVIQTLGRGFSIVWHAFNAFLGGFTGLFLFASIVLAIFLILAQRRMGTLARERGREHAYIRAVLANLTDGVIEYVPGGQIISANPAAERLLGLPIGSIAKKQLGDLKRDPMFASLAKVFPDPEPPASPSTGSGQAGPGGPLRPPRLGEAGQSVSEASDPARVEITLTEPVERILTVATIPLPTSPGVWPTAIKLIRDHTRERLLDKMKSEFISIAAHQLRTPLSGVKWTLRALLAGDLGKLDELQTKYIQRACDSNERMIQLVGDLLDASRQEQGRFEYEFEIRDFPAFLKALVEQQRPQFEAKGLALEADIPDIHVQLSYDPERMALVFNNLLENSLRYTNKGGRVSVRLADEEKQVRVDVADTGVGIPKDQMPKLFTKFFRADNVVRMQTEGTGLGLFIVKNIVAAHNGDIALQSQENVGTTITITLPHLPDEVLRKQQFVPVRDGA